LIDPSLVVFVFVKRGMIDSLQIIYTLRRMMASSSICRISTLCTRACKLNYVYNTLSIIVCSVRLSDYKICGRIRLVREGWI